MLIGPLTSMLLHGGDAVISKVSGECEHRLSSISQEPLLVAPLVWVAGHLRQQ